MLHRIHVNQHVIKKNRKTGGREPVLTCKNYQNTEYADEIVIYDLHHKEVARLVYRPDKPLSCGAHVWIEVDDKNAVIEIVKNNTK